MLLAALAAVQLAVAAPSAQSGAPPDPATLVLPDMTPTRDPHVIGDGWRHFYFHKPGVAYEEAYRDFSDCYRFLPTAGADPRLPMFVPWTERPGAAQLPQTSYGGLVGSVILGLVSGPINRRDRQSRMRRCMEPRGYVRYPLAEEIWRQLIDDYSQRSIALQALVASRAAPALPQVTR
jgi:hypothetical protein